MIGPFEGEYRWLSNFWLVPVKLDGVTYPSVEHAYQAAKTVSQIERVFIRSALHPAEAKRLGRYVTQQPCWDEMRLGVMLGLLRQKFAVQYLRRQLLETGDEEIVEVNTWGDTFWGVCKGVGANRLGWLIMQIRDELRFPGREESRP